MKRMLTDLIAAALIAITPTSASSLLLYPDGMPITYDPPQYTSDLVTSRVIRSITYDNPFAINPSCLLEQVPFIQYSLRTEKNETLSDVVRQFREAGVPEGLLEDAQSNWEADANYYLFVDDKGRLPAGYVFGVAQLGSCKDNISPDKK